MKFNKKQIKESYKIFNSFSYTPSTNLTEGKKIKMPAYLVKYLENKKANTIKISKAYKDMGTTYHVEYYDNIFIFVRVVDDNESRVVLTPKDLELINDKENITVADVKALVKKVSTNEKRFGL